MKKFIPWQGQNGPWYVKKSLSCYENPWVHVFHEQVTTPAKTAGIYGRIHFKNAAVAIIALTEQDEIYLVKQFRYPLRSNSIELPMGGCAHKDDPLSIAKKELKEETGLSARKWQQIQFLHTSNSVTDEKAFVFVAESLTQGASQLEDTEDIEVIKKPFKEVLTWALTGKITDAISIAAIYHLQILRIAQQKDNC